MVRNLILIGIIGAVFLFFALIKGKDFKSLKYIILIGPFVIGAIIYGSIFILTKNMSPDVCDGGALMMVLLAFMFIGLGILINLAYLVHWIINKGLKNNKNMKYKNHIIVIITLVLIGVFFFRNNTRINRKISKDLGIKVPNTLSFQYEDTHGGFHGDGITLAKANLKNRDVEIIIKKSKSVWMKTPISDKVELELYGGTKGEMNRESDLAKSLEMPKIEDGYWIFLDRFGGKKVFNKGENLFPRASGNYSLGVIDSKENIFYYIKFDS